MFCLKGQHEVMFVTSGTIIFNIANEDPCSKSEKVIARLRDIYSCA